MHDSFAVSHEQDTKRAGVASCTERCNLGVYVIHVLRRAAPANKADDSGHLIVGRRTKISMFCLMVGSHFKPTGDLHDKNILLVEAGVISGREKFTLA